jgi:hypothetical protein
MSSLVLRDNVRLVKEHLENYTLCTTMLYVKYHIHIMGFEIFTAVVTKSSVFRDTILCNTFKINRRFGEICHSILRVER